MDFKFADVGEGITEGEIVRWHVDEGDAIEENETLVEVETDKAIVEIPSPCDGVVESIPFEAGETIAVGEVLAVIDTDESVEDSESTTVVGEISTEAEVLDEDDSENDAAGNILATPKTRKLADDLNVDLTEVTGTGEDGRITEEDVREAAEGTENEYGPVERIDLKGVRKRIAEQTRRSHEEIPQVTHMDEIDVTELDHRIRDLRNERDDLSYKLTLTPFLVRAIVESLGDHPYLNASFNGDEIVLKKYYNVGVTVDTEDGLIVPVVRNADELSVLEIGEEVSRLAERTRNRSIELSELKGGTFTLTNVGFVGGTWATPQVNHPQCAILAAGRAREKPVVRDGEVTARTMLPVSLSFDHRILDGAEAARFTNDLGEMLSNPAAFSL